jgi:hypothetical protein
VILRIRPSSSATNSDGLPCWYASATGPSSRATSVSVSEMASSATAGGPVVPVPGAAVVAVVCGTVSAPGSPSSSLVHATVATATKAAIITLIRLCAASRLVRWVAPCANERTRRERTHNRSLGSLIASPG